MENKTSITSAALRQLLGTNKNILILDVRSLEEFQAKHIPSAVNIPVDEIEKGNLKPLPDQVIITVCNSGGGRSERAARLLKESGYAECYFLEEGTLGWFDREHNRNIH